MPGKHSIRVFDLVVNYHSGDSFSNSLTPPSSLDRTTLATVGNEISIDYTIPARICRVNSDGTSYFSAASILALLDDFSSYGLLMQDRNHRPGVSVKLNTEILRTCKAGEKVRLVSRCDKIGKSMAFCSMEVLSSSGKVLARGKHLKFVQMGFLWDLLTSALLFPLVLMVLEYMISKNTKKTPKNTEESAAPIVVGQVFEDLNLIEVQDPSNLFNSRLQTASADSNNNHNKKKSKDSFTYDPAEKYFTLKVNKSLSNVLGAMHGGAVAAAAEEACIQLAASAKSSAASKGCIHAIEVTYLSPTKGELIVAVKDDQLALAGRATTTGRVLNHRTGVVCAEFNCVWSQ